MLQTNICFPTIVINTKSYIARIFRPAERAALALHSSALLNSALQIRSTKSRICSCDQLQLQLQRQLQRPDRTIFHTIELNQKRIQKKKTTAKKTKKKPNRNKIKIDDSVHSAEYAHSNKISKPVSRQKIGEWTKVKRLGRIT